jgi:hypothetical protein
MSAVVALHAHDHVVCSIMCVRSANRTLCIGVMGLCLLCTLFGRWTCAQLAVPPSIGGWVAEPVIQLRSDHSPADYALREASRTWAQAHRRVTRELEARHPAWELDDGFQPALEAARRRLLARDRGGDLGRARAAARLAAAVARTPAEACRAASLLALIDRDAGRQGSGPFLPGNPARRSHSGDSPGTR